MGKETLPRISAFILEKRSKWEAMYFQGHPSASGQPATTTAPLGIASRMATQAIPPPANCQRHCWRSFADASPPLSTRLLLHSSLSRADFTVAGKTFSSPLLPHLSPHQPQRTRRPDLHARLDRSKEAADPLLLLTQDRVVKHRRTLRARQRLRQRRPTRSQAASVERQMPSRQFDAPPPPILLLAVCNRPGLHHRRRMDWRRGHQHMPHPGVNVAPNHALLAVPRFEVVRFGDVGAVERDFHILFT